MNATHLGCSQYNNRWFVLCRFFKRPGLSLISLDRIIAVKLSKEKYKKPETNVFHYFDDLIGVSKTSKQRAIRIKLRVQKSQLPYLLTKPMHPTQEILKEEEVKA